MIRQRKGTANKRAPKQHDVENMAPDKIKQMFERRVGSIINVKASEYKSQRNRDWRGETDLLPAMQPKMCTNCTRGYEQTLQRQH